MNHQKVVPLLQNDLNWRSICFQIAATHPNVFYDAYLEVHYDHVKERVQNVLNGDRNNKISAIKEYRNSTDSTLKEAADYVNALIETLHL